MSLIEISNFIKNYSHHQVTINNITVNKRITILVGENGCGKSTVLKAIAKLITYQGTITTKLDCVYLPEINRLPKDSDTKTFVKDFLDTCEYNPDIYQELLEGFQLKEHMSKLTAQLSKGMHTKINLLLCLSMEKDLFLLDEPLRGLDKEAVIFLTQFIQRSQKIYLISSHQKDEFLIGNAEVIQL